MCVREYLWSNFYLFFVSIDVKFYVFKFLSLFLLDVKIFLMTFFKITSLYDRKTFILIETFFVIIVHDPSDTWTEAIYF